VSAPLILVLVTPIAGAVLAPAFGDVAVQRRVLAALCSAAAIGGAVWAVVRTVSGSEVAWRGLTLDPWRALLVFGAVAASAAAIARADGTSRPGMSQAAIFAATAAGIAPLVVTSSHLLAVTLPVSTLGLAVASFAAISDPSRALRSVRAVATLAASDALALVALGLALEKGSALPPKLSTTAAAVLLAAAIVRLGVTPGAGPSADASRAHGSIGLLWLGPVRAQGFLLAVFAVGAHRGVAYAAAASAALGIVVVGTTASRRSRRGLLPALGTGVALLGFSLGGAIPTSGAVLALAAAFAGPVAFSSGGVWSAGARTTLSTLPAGGLIAGSALVLGAALAAGAIEPWFLALAVPATVGLLAAVGSVWAARGEGGRASGFPAAFAASIGIATGLALAAVPERTTDWLALPVAQSLGVGRLLSVGGEPGMADGLALIVLGVALIALLAGPGRLGSGGAPSRMPAVRFAVAFEWWAWAARAPGRGSGFAASRAASETRRWTIVATALFAVAVGLAARVYIVAAGRGFL
jgi:hypothetical protein